MPIPTYDQFISPLLSTLAKNPAGLSTTQAFEAVANATGLTVEDRQQLLPSGHQPTYSNRIAWAHDRLKRAACSPERRYE